MFGLSKVNLLFLASLAVPALGASLRGDTSAIEVRKGRPTNVGGLFREGETVRGVDIGLNGIILACGDYEVCSEALHAWRINQGGSTTGIYEELQAATAVWYPDYSLPWTEANKFAIHLAPADS